MESHWSNGTSLASGSQQHMLDFIKRIGAFDTFGSPAVRLAAGVVTLIAAAWLARLLVRVAGRSVLRRSGPDRAAKFAAALRQIEGLIVRTGGLGILVLACVILAAPSALTNALVLALSLYLTIAVGLLAIRFADLIVDGIETLSLFILFENIYLVGDLIEVGPAHGVVEAIEFRTTKVRDTEGRLHIIRNGDMKPVINYSRDYTVAVVAVDVAYDADLQRVFAALRQTGAALRHGNPDVLEETSIEGIVAFGASSMTVRTTTRVKPGRHETVAAALRLLIKETFDREAAGMPRKSLIPDIPAARRGVPVV